MIFAFSSRSTGESAPRRSARESARRASESEVFRLNRRGSPHSDRGCTLYTEPEGILGGFATAGELLLASFPICWVTRRHR